MPAAKGQIWKCLQIAKDGQGYVGFLMIRKVAVGSAVVASGQWSVVSTFAYWSSVAVASGCSKNEQNQRRQKKPEQGEREKDTDTDRHTHTQTHRGRNIDPTSHHHPHPHPRVELQFHRQRRRILWLAYFVNSLVLLKYVD